MKSINKSKQGKRNRINGSRWEAKVRADLESKGWNISRFCNNVDNEGNIVPAKSTKFRSNTHGFPDFLIWKWVSFPKDLDNIAYVLGEAGEKWKQVAMNQLKKSNLGSMSFYVIIGVECKSNGYLDKIEKSKGEILIRNGVFTFLVVAKKSKDEKDKRKVVPKYTIQYKKSYGW